MNSFQSRLMVLLIIFSSGTLTITSANDIQQFTLENGMKIIVLEDDSIPNANMYLFWRV